MAHFSDEDPVGKKVRLRFAVAEAVIVDKLVVKQGEKQPLKGSKECVTLAGELSNTLKAKSGRGFLEGSNNGKTVGVGSKKGSGEDETDTDKTFNKEYIQVCIYSSFYIVNRSICSSSYLKPSEAAWLQFRELLNCVDVRAQLQLSKTRNKLEEYTLT